MDTEIVLANLSDARHERAVLEMIDAYAREPTANGAALSDDVRDALVPGLRAHPSTVIFLAYRADAPVGAAICFVGFSTFAARPLLNVHDLIVLAPHRRAGVGRRLLDAAEAFARERHFCKLTLEVQENNANARALYDRVGFESYELDPATGRAFVMQKKLWACDSHATSSRRSL